jgi:hypothetical protein
MTWPSWKPSDGKLKDYEQSPSSTQQTTQSELREIEHREMGVELDRAELRKSRDKGAQQG